MVIYVTQKTINNEPVYRVWSPEATGNTVFVDITFGSFYSLDSLRENGFSGTIKDIYWEAMKATLADAGEYSFESTEGMGGPR